MSHCIEVLHDFQKTSNILSLCQRSSTLRILSLTPGAKIRWCFYFITRMLKWKPDEGSTAKELLSDPWLYTDFEDQQSTHPFANLRRCSTWYLAWTPNTVFSWKILDNHALRRPCCKSYLMSWTPSHGFSVVAHDLVASGLGNYQRLNAQRE